jgi:hypothetical protein
MIAGQFCRVMGEINCLGLKPMNVFKRLEPPQENPLIMPDLVKTNTVVWKCIKSKQQTGTHYTFFFIDIRYLVWTLYKVGYIFN